MGKQSDILNDVDFVSCIFKHHHVVKNKLAEKREDMYNARYVDLMSVKVLLFDIDPRKEDELLR